MTKHEINKYPPTLFKHGRFLLEDWTACTDIGHAIAGRALDKQEYLRVEVLYVEAVVALARAVTPDLLQVHDVEFWDTASERLSNLGLADVFDGSAAPVQGEPVSGSRLDNLVRRCLREAAWLELMVPSRLLVHFGYDMRLIVASEVSLSDALDEIRFRGLFVYDSDAALPSIASWSSG